MIHYEYFHRFMSYKLHNTLRKKIALDQIRMGRISHKKRGTRMLMIVYCQKLFMLQDSIHSGELQFQYCMSFVNLWLVCMCYHTYCYTLHMHANDRDSINLWLMTIFDPRNIMNSFIVGKCRLTKRKILNELAGLNLNWKWQIEKKTIAWHNNIQ